MITRAGVASAMRSQPDARPIGCVIRGHCRTRVFSLPGADLAADDHIQPVTVLARPEVKATVVSDLLGYLSGGSPFRHFAIDCSLRARVNEAIEKRGNRQADNQHPLFLVLESEVPCKTVMDEGTCFIVDQGKVVGGNAGEEAITAWRVGNAPWPEVQDDQVFVNSVLAAVRIVQDETDVIPQLAEVSCFFDADDRAVYPITFSASAKGSVVSVLSPKDVEVEAGRFRKLAEAFAVAPGEHDRALPVLVEALRLEDIDNDDYRRGWYLCLFEAIEGGLGGKYRQLFHQRHRAYRKTIGHPKPGTKMDMEEFNRLQRDVFSELRRMYLGQ